MPNPGNAPSALKAIVIHFEATHPDFEEPQNLTTKFMADDLAHGLEQLYHEAEGESLVVINITELTIDGELYCISNGLPLIAVDENEYFLPPTLANSHAVIHSGALSIHLSATAEGLIGDLSFRDTETVNELFCHAHIE